MKSACVCLQFGSEYSQFCAELALRVLKQDRFDMDASKIQRHESDYDVAMAGITSTCQAVAHLFAAHDQMRLAALMTVFYLAPSNDVFTKLNEQLLGVEHLPKEHVSPADVDEEVYKEIFCVVDSLRQSEFNPTRGWGELG